MKKIVYISLIIFAFLLSVSGVQTVYAANLHFYNYNTNKNVTYTGKQATYIYNNRELVMETPGILISGTALADYEALFVHELGLQAVREEDVITITDGITTLKLTLGSKKVQLNNKSETMSVAPVKLKFDNDIVKYYVPTRFVAEAFGFDYVWNSSTSTVKITKTFQLLVNEKTVLYNGTLYSLSYKDQVIGLSFPILYYNNNILVPAKNVFETAGCQYEENNTYICITKGNISVSMEFNKPEAIINEFSFSMNTCPIVITNQETGCKESYVPLEFVSTMLGFQLTYQDSERNYTLVDTEYLGKQELHPELMELLKKKEQQEEFQQNIDYYYEWIAKEEQSASEAELKQITKIVAYASEKADVLEIYGITREDINDFIDNQTLVFEIKNSIANMGTQFFVDFETPHINYTFLKTIKNDTKMLFMIPIEDMWHFVEQKDCLQVYFTNADLSLEDLKIAWEEPEEVLPEEPVIVYPEDKLVIPMPKTFIDTPIIDADNYLDHNFELKILGNHIEFFEQTPILNPYSYINNITVKYDADTNYTIITCFTDEIYGYKILEENGYLAITVDKPSTIYNKIIVLDAGHGGKDPGAVRNNIYEKDLNYSILYSHAKDLFETSDIKVYYTRDTDVFISLNDRAKFATLVDADMFISLHMNSSENNTANGTEVFYSKSNNKKLESGLNSYQLAKTLATNISTAMETKLRGTTKADYYVVKYNSVPAVLIELGFISNEEERNKLVDENYQKKAAEAIYQSVMEIFSAYPTGR